MSSPAKRRHNRIARRKSKVQAENARWNKREARHVDLVPPHRQLNGLRDVTPFYPVALIGAKP